ncbi:hypothetical protein [Actinoplanes solisilvae]|uniref:hypothetical protein n=1 Tax=Actinoplanes solisilvae TaxID=2486853 RepID=UPI000FD76B10|nr:hypothetical protein [Actinoplanes solisilvae]
MRLPFLRSGPQRVVALTTAVALGTGGVGWLVGQQVRSPADAAADHRPPPASLVTVPVTQRVLTATVTTQGTVAYNAPQPVTLNGTVAAAEAGAVPLVTKAPAGNRTLREGDVLLEVSGRPVFVLTGKVPMYRTLTKGSTGDDARQLRAALRRLMPKRRVASSGPLDGRTLEAVRAWYDDQGYKAAEPTAEQRAQLRQLEQAAAVAGPGQADARADLAAFRTTYGVSIASGEIIFLPRLPVRLTTVSLKAGAPASGVIGMVADPTLVVTGAVSPDDVDLVKTGMTATLQSPGGDRFTAVLSRIGGATTTGDLQGVPVRLTPREPAELAAYVGQALKVSITVGGTGHAVLTVPVAAVFTASDGQARVTVEDRPGTVRDVAVEPGLSTGGFVQVTPAAPGELRVGARVVVGST